jgi:hypothetical protein
LSDHVFSAARLRGYRAIEAAGGGEAVRLQILDTAIGAQLWLPLSLVEVAFRNCADRNLTGAHERGKSWLLESDLDDGDLLAGVVKGLEAFVRIRDDGSADDPVAEAALRASQHLNRDRISRDDLIAHLMLGFWVVRVPEGLRGSGLDVFSLAAAELEGPLAEPAELRDVLVNQVAQLRNRVAHHEPVLFRSKHIFTKTGDPKLPIDLIASLTGAIQKFVRNYEEVFTAATSFAPMAADHLEEAKNAVGVLLTPFAEHLSGRLEELRHETRVRRAARRA